MRRTWKMTKNINMVGLLKVGTIILIITITTMLTTISYAGECRIVDAWSNEDLEYIGIKVCYFNGIIENMAYSRISVYIDDAFYKERTERFSTDEHNNPACRYEDYYRIWFDDDVPPGRVSVKVELYELAESKEGYFSLKLCEDSKNLTITIPETTTPTLNVVLNGTMDGTHVIYIPEARVVLEDRTSWRSPLFFGPIILGAFIVLAATIIRFGSK